jgi:membrane-bound lytic murein transglycosylase D
MRRSLYQAVLLALCLISVSCAQHSLQLWPDKHPPSDPPPKMVQATSPLPASVLATEPTDPLPKAENLDPPATKASITARTPASPAQPAEHMAQDAGESDENDFTTEPATDQKRIDLALDIYQEALDSWGKGDPEKAIDLLDQCYHIIWGIQTGADPEIAQQKEDLRLLISKRILEIYAARSHVQVGQNREIPLAINDYVEREIKSFQTLERGFFVEAYRRSGAYRPFIEEQLRKAGLPEELSWLPLIESGFKVKALSKARALGLWQFIASTAYRFDLRRDRWVDDRMDLERSTQAAITYLKGLHDLFGDWTTVLAAYNCGEGNVLRVIREQRVNYLDNFWDLYSRLPAETARYVPRFLAALHIIKDPEKYGLADLHLDKPLVCDRVQVNRQMRLTDIASALDVPVDKLEELNPALRYSATPDYAFVLNVPSNTGDLLLSKLEQIPLWQPPKVTVMMHRVRPGETLSGIAAKYRVALQRIVLANGLRSAGRIRAGQRLKIPVRGQILAAESDPPGKPGSAIQYRVKRGDTLWTIAKRFNTTVDRIKALNSIDSNLLQSGQLIVVQSGKP